MNKFSLAEYADIVYLYEYCDVNGLQASRENHGRFTDRRKPSQSFCYR
jgi:hypothetical protein